jgi:hypothetical protein
MTIDTIKYEKILFSEKRTNRTVTKYGYKIGKFLAVSYVSPKFNQYIDNYWRVFRFTDGLPAIETTFTTKQDAIRFAEWLDGIYGDYFILWTHYPEAEIYRWTYLTIERGEEYWEYLEELKTKRNIEWKGYENELHTRVLS